MSRLSTKNYNPWATGSLRHFKVKMLCATLKPLHFLFFALCCVWIERNIVHYSSLEECTPRKWSNLSVPGNLFSYRADRGDWTMWDSLGHRDLISTDTTFYIINPHTFSSSSYISSFLSCSGLMEWVSDCIFCLNTVNPQTGQNSSSLNPCSLKSLSMKLLLILRNYPVLVQHYLLIFNWKECSLDTEIKRPILTIKYLRNVKWSLKS